jgi:uncharacterized protein YjbI with pentapeptide repeats
MANKKELTLLKKGIQTWNAWRAKHPGELVDLREADLVDAELRGVDLRNSRLESADLTSARLNQARLCSATLTNAHVFGAEFTNADLRDCEMSGVMGGETKFSREANRRRSDS